MTMTVAQRRKANGKHGEVLPLASQDIVSPQQKSSKKKRKGGRKINGTVLCLKLIGYTVFLLGLSTMFVVKTGRQEDVKEKMMEIKHRVTGNTAKYADLEIVRRLFKDKVAAVNDCWVVFVTVSDLKETYVGRGLSPKSAKEALIVAQSRVPRKTNKFSYVKIDIVTGVRRLTNYNYVEGTNEIPSGWFGIALDWETDYFFLPDEVRANAMMDDNNYIRWERIALYAAKHSLRGGEYALPDAGDDASVMPVLDLFHTESVFVDYQNDLRLELYHGHRMYRNIKANLLLEKAREAGSYLIHNVNHDGKMAYRYNPRSDFEPPGYHLARHAGTIYSMACLYKRWKNSGLREAMKRAVLVLLRAMEDCPLPFSQETKSKCLVEHGEQNEKVSKIDTNALGVLAMVEYVVAAAPEDTADLIVAAGSLAGWIGGAQNSNGTFVQKVTLDHKNHNSILKLDDEQNTRNNAGVATFALTRLQRTATSHSWHTVPANILGFAHKAAAAVIQMDSKVNDADLTIDHWLLNGISEMDKISGDLPAEFFNYTKRVVSVGAKYQNGEMTDPDQLDTMGIYYQDLSAASTAATSEGLCSVYDMAKKRNDNTMADLILKTVALSIRYQLQSQFYPEAAMMMRNPSRVLGGFHESIRYTDMRIDYTQHNLASLLCFAQLPIPSS